VYETSYLSPLTSYRRSNLKRWKYRIWFCRCSIYVITFNTQYSYAFRALHSSVFFLAITYLHLTFWYRLRHVKERRKGGGSCGLCALPHASAFTFYCTGCSVSRCCHWSVADALILVRTRCWGWRVVLREFGWKVNGDNYVMRGGENV
jgi:hypothetical protein